MVFDLNLVIGLVLGFLLGWLVEWLIDRAYWRRGDERTNNQVTLLEAEVGRLQAELDAMRLRLRDLPNLQSRLEAAEKARSELAARLPTLVEPIRLTAAENEIAALRGRLALAERELLSLREFPHRLEQAQAEIERLRAQHVRAGEEA